MIDREAFLTHFDCGHARQMISMQCHRLHNKAAAVVPQARLRISFCSEDLQETSDLSCSKLEDRPCRSQSYRLSMAVGVPLVSSKIVHCLNTSWACLSPSLIFSLAKMSHMPWNMVGPRCCKEMSCCNGMLFLWAAAFNTVVIGSRFDGMLLSFARGSEMQRHPTAVNTCATLCWLLDALGSRGCLLVCSGVRWSGCSARKDPGRYRSPPTIGTR